ncbi:hypothetical protein BE21_18250 [Sorangium cellulosum]|uniref:DUF3540 domain-containing protein n=1 Tax=Sorangium cellulosum TaxID=56 RepID=A0A150TXI6_SORCE|nr:hypothetical protein BE21_18250 [Sorangium cellulosum]
MAQVPEAILELGQVESRSGHKARVRAPSGEREAEIAPSCLVSPAPGDRVLVVSSGDEAYVLAVLRRRHAGPTNMVFHEDLSLSVLNGRLRILAQEGVDLVSPRDVHVRAGAVAADAGEVRVAFSLLDLVGQSIAARTKKVRVVAEALDTIAGRIYQRAQTFFRRTDELDRVEAKNMDRRAEELYHLHGQNAVTTADQLVKIDAGQVHVG